MVNQGEREEEHTDVKLQAKHIFVLGRHSQHVDCEFGPGDLLGELDSLGDGVRSWCDGAGEGRVGVVAISIEPGPSEC